MTPTQIELIRASWATLEPLAGATMAVFYERLYELDPSLRHLFLRGDGSEQRKNFSGALTVAVDRLDRVDDLVPSLWALGRRHATYGVRPAHYDTVRAALLWTLELALGSSFSGELRGAWETAYDTLAAVMIAAGEDVSVAAA